ncbi:MAG: RNA 3'-terminal phosphate cyclase [Aquificae bacterium]|nr:RNA 3'-terminal phosphate cyclase [Aquificota bacterium]
MEEFLEIDGSHGEGGGQIVRTALFLSTLLNTPIRIFNIRAGRERPGLKVQHVNIVKLLKRFAKAKVKGDEVGSTELIFIPRSLKGGYYEVNFDTAGSITLFFQTILPLTLFTPGETTIKVVGGTDVPKSPTVDWLRFVFLPYVYSIPSSMRLEVLKRGFYPAGGGIVQLTVKTELTAQPADLKEVRDYLKGRLNLRRTKRGEVRKVHVFSVAHEELRERKVAERQAKGALEALKSLGYERIEVYRQYAHASSIGTSVTVWLEDTEGNLLGADSLGKKGKLAEVVGAEAVKKLHEDWASGATVDRHLADHLVPFLGLAGGEIVVPRFTRHLLTNVWVCELFLGKVFELDEKKRIVRARP